jgi:hypothetical protein
MVGNDDLKTHTHHETPEYRAYVRALVDAAPPLTPGQIAKLRTLFGTDDAGPVT